ncbi:MAG: heavy metal-binding domain-containing protein, partial [Acidimicrobiales bacterium]
ALLHSAGWEPLGLAFGASFVHVPRRGAATAMRQKGQNVELVNFTEALYSARESAMERMQASALAFQASGVVAVRVSEGPMAFAGHSVGFTAWGTAVRLSPGGHNYLQPRVVVSLDDAVQQFAAESLRGD